MNLPIEEISKQLFSEARSHSFWLPKPVEDSTLMKLYDMLKWGPTSANSCPARFVFVKSTGEKEKLLKCMAAGNVEKTRTAPVTAIIASDMEFYEHLPRLMPHMDFKSLFIGNAPLIASSALRNGSLQGAYLMVAARLLGLDCGPMSGFDPEKVDAEFFKGTTWRANFICNLGYGDKDKLFPRSPRLSFDEACRVV